MSTATPYEPSTKPTDPTVNLRRRPNIDALAQTGITPTSTENAALQILALRPEVEQGILNDQAKQAVKARLFGEAEVPSMIGRFKVIRELGRGGTGIVYIAYDIELDRKIAVKLLNNERPDERTGSANARLLREAQSMARVSHPNIAAVHEVGMFCGQIYVAMEFVDGKTLAAWLQGNRELPWQDVLAVFRQAAAGLAAAHDAGLVHRDFKPANAILGEDDRLRVLDFGLARADATPGGIAALDRTDEGNLDMSSASIDDSKLDLSLTVTGTVLGTPAYMSPEQFLGQRIDAKSDQFSFCVALYEALYRERPFDGDTLSSLMAAVLAGKVRDTHSSRVPRWLRAVVLRGLRNDPEQRWPSMYALSKALTPEHRHRGPVFAALGLGALLTGAASSWLGQADAAAQICSGAQEQLTGVWDEPRRQQVREAMLATGAPGAETIVDRIGERLDAYAADFVAAHTDACEATNVRKEQTQELMAQRMTCLAERRHALAATTNLLAAADKQIAENAAEMVAGLPAVDRCNDPLYVAEQLKPPDDLNIKRRVDGARAMLTEASVREHAGKFSTALDLVEQAAESVKDIDYPPLTAEIALGRGSLLEMNSRYADARPALEEAYFTALSAGHTRVAIDAAVELVLVTGRRLMTPDAMQTWARHAEALIHRSGDDVQRARLAANLGKGAFLVSEYGTGADRQKKAREFYLTALKTYELKNDRLYIAHMQMAIGETYQYDQRTLDKSEEYFTSAIDSFKVAACDEHPGVALGLTLLASVHRMQERLDDAQAELEKAGDLIAATVGKDHRNYGLNLFGQAEVHISRKHWAVAEPLLRRALEIHSEREGPLHINTIGVRELLGNVLVRQGKYTEAIAILDALVTDLEARTDPDPYYLAKTAQFLYEAHAGLRRGGEVVPRLQAIHDRLAQRLKPAAIPATILFALAQARLDRDHDLTAARPLVEAARANADSADLQDEELRQELDDWLARHPAPR
jgi:tetratricopeptide (TPR) repeat protein/predicted Ser/Thr protein kinase